MPAPKLFMFYIGGDFANSNIELHDVRFSVGGRPRDCYDDLRSQWWGTPSSLHIDSWLEVDQVDGYDVRLDSVPFSGAEKLFFLNLGGYTSEDFEEVHRNILVVAKSQRQAIQRTIQSQSSWKLPHKDSLLEIEKAISVSEQLENRGFFIHLTRALQLKTQVFNTKYIRLNRE